MYTERDVLELLQGVGAVLLRHERHKVYRLPNGRHVSVPISPKGCHWVNTYHQVRRLAGLAPANRGLPGSRRPRRSAGPRPPRRAITVEIRTPSLKSLQEQLSRLKEA